MSISGDNKDIFKDTRPDDSRIDDGKFGDAALRMIPGMKSKFLTEQKKPLEVRGDNAAFGSMPDKHEMPPTKAKDDPNAPDQDEEPVEVGEDDEMEAAGDWSKGDAPAKPKKQLPESENRRLATPLERAMGCSMAEWKMYTDPSSLEEATPAPVKDMRRFAHGREVERRQGIPQTSHLAAGDSRVSSKKSRDYNRSKPDETHRLNQAAKDPVSPKREIKLTLSKAKLPESKENTMARSFLEATGLTSMRQWNELAGITESYSLSDPPGYADGREGKTGDLPTGGVDKQNKMKAGLPGLEGTPVQAIEPEEGNEDNVGDSKAVTFDDAIAMLKKEGVELADLWDEFLENKGLTTALFSQLIDEATESEDQDEMNALLAVEDLFKHQVVMEGGFLDRIMKKKKPEVSPAIAKGGDLIKKHGADAVRAANAKGMAVDKKAMGEGKMPPQFMKKGKRPMKPMKDEKSMKKPMSKMGKMMDKYGKKK